MEPSTTTSLEDLLFHRSTAKSLPFLFFFFSIRTNLIWDHLQSHTHTLALALSRLFFLRCARRSIVGISLGRAWKEALEPTVTDTRGLQRRSDLAFLLPLDYQSIGPSRETQGRRERERERDRCCRRRPSLSFPLFSFLFVSVDPSKDSLRFFSSIISVCVDDGN